MDSRIYDTVLYGSLILVLIAVGLLLRNFKHQPLEFKWLAFVLLLSLSCDVAGEILYQFKLGSLNLAGTTYYIISPFLFASFFSHCLKWEKWKSPIILVGTLLLIFSLMNCVFMQKQGINSYSATLLSLFIMSLSIVYYYKLLNELPTDRIQDLPLFWIVSSFFFTHAGKLVLEIVSHYMVTVMKDNLMVLWSLHNGLTALGLFILIRGIWLQNRLLHLHLDFKREP